MSNQETLNINDQNTGGEFARHWLLVLVCAAGIGVGAPYSTRVNKIIVNRLLKSHVNRLLKNLPVDNVVLLKAPTRATLAPAAATNEQPKQEKTARSTFTWSTAKLEVKEYLTFKASRGTRKR